MTRLRGCLLNTISWTRLLFREGHVKRFIFAACFVIAASLLVPAQTRPGSLAGLIQRGERKAALERIRAGADVNEPQPDGTRPIHWAVFKVDYELLDALVARKAKADVTNEFGDTPLAEAVKVADRRMVKTLLDAGAGVESPNLDGETALLYAARDGCYDCAEALIAQGADVNVPTMPEGVTPVMIALDNDNNDIARLLLDHGANPHVWDWYGRTALYIAVDRKEGGSSGGGLRVAVDTTHSARSSVMDIIKALLAANVDPNPELRMHRPTRGGYTGRFSDPLLDTGA